MGKKFWKYGANDEVVDTTDVASLSLNTTFTEWDSTIEYAAEAKVVYDKKLYVALKESTGVVPSDSTSSEYWKEITIPDRIATATAEKHANAYSSATTYAAGKFVAYEGKWFLSKKETIGNTPVGGDSDEFWSEMNLSTLFTSANTSLTAAISQLANVADAQIQTDGKLLITYQDGTKQTFAGGTEIKKDGSGNYYYDVED